MAAGVPDEAGKRQLVQSDQPHTEQSTWGFTEFTLPVPGATQRWRNMPAVGCAAHLGRHHGVFRLDLIETVNHRIEGQHRGGVTRLIVLNRL